MSMVERVARAIIEDMRPGFTIDDQDIDLYSSTARAAIEAMREPSEEMIAAADRVHDLATAGDPVLPDYVWHAMIDAALVE